MKDIVIERFLGQANLELLQNIIELDQQFLDPSWTVQQWKELFENFEQKSFILDLARTKEPGELNPERVLVVGLALWLRSGDVLHLLKIATRENVRRCQVAQRLWAKGELELSQQLPSIFLEVECSNKVALAFYQRQGVQVLQQVKDFYGPGRHAFRCQKELFAPA